MTCKKCTYVPRFRSGPCKVYIQSSVHKLIDKVKKAVDSVYNTHMVCRDYFEVDVKDFKEFISQLNNMEVLSLKESSAIKVVL